MSTSRWEPTSLPLTPHWSELSQMAITNHMSQAGKWIPAVQSGGSRFEEDLGSLP